MKIIIREAKIIDSTSPFHNKTVDILIVDGLIKKLASSQYRKCRKVELENSICPKVGLTAVFR
jgi:dihydroorotase